MAQLCEKGCGFFGIVREGLQQTLCSACHATATGQSDAGFLTFLFPIFASLTVTTSSQ